MKRNAVASVLTMAFERLLLMGNRWAPGPASLALVLRSHVLTIRSAGEVSLQRSWLLHCYRRNYTISAWPLSWT
jgi:hypothetical protein